MNPARGVQTRLRRETAGQARKRHEQLRGTFGKQRRTAVGTARKSPRTTQKEATGRKLSAGRGEAARKSLHRKRRNATADLSRLNDSASNNIYEALSEDEIRLLVLQPGLRDQPVKCRLKQSKLSSLIDSEYEALSYVWGSEATSTSITLCSHNFYVTQNLFDALLELRRPDIERVLWIDALCINQCDRIERSNQVLVMSKIYERAEEVIAWLGPATEDVEPALKLLGKAEVNPSPADLVYPSLKEGLKLLMNRQYWYRAWIVQEIAFARLVRIQCGKYSVYYKTLEQALDMNSSVVSATVTPGDSTASVISPIPFSKRLLGPQLASSENSDGISPDLFLDSLLDRECSNPRDSVFAFYGLFSETLRERITVDYRLEPMDVVLQAVSAIIETTQSLSAVATRSRQKVPIGKAHAWQQEMPSWCPYVSTSFEHDSLAAWQKTPDHDAVHPKISVDLSKRHVHTHGFTIGTISEIIPCRERFIGGDEETFNEGQTDRILHHFSIWAKYGLSIPEFEESSEAPQGTMVVSSGRESRPLGARRSHKAIRYWRYMRKRQLCCVEIANSEALPALGVVPAAARKRDKICWIIGSPSPLVLRIPRCKGTHGQLCQVVGEAYIKDVYGFVGTTKPESFILR